MTALRLQVACPAYTTTGGPEALHQLVHTARGLGADARMVYLDRGREPDRPPTAEPFRVYDIAIDERIDDARGVVLVVPETETQLLDQRRRLHKAIWWLSVDNYRVALENLRAQRPRRWSKRWWKGWLRPPPRPFDLARPDPAVFHLAQSEYARRFLHRHGLQRIGMLTDYLRDDFLEQATAGGLDRERGRRVAFNPKKGIEVTRALIDRAAGRFDFVPIQNMTPRQVVELLCSSAIYIDFGPHPGRDRIPREAAACGCAVLTGRRGAAANEVDLPLPAEFRIDESQPGFADVALEAMERVVAAPTEVALIFDAYRAVILDQKRLFREEVRVFLEQAAAAHGA